jgi:hypothetical protein
VRELGPLGIVPWSLGNLLAIKGEPGVIQSILDTLYPTLDALPFIAGPNCRETVAQTVAVNAKGSFTFNNLNPTQGEAWLINGLGFTSTLAAGDSLRGQLILQGEAGQGMRQLTDQDTGTAGIVLAKQLRVDPFVLYPGQIISFFANDFTSAGTINVGATATIFRFHS